MFTKNKYQLIKASGQVDTDGNFYPDIITFPINKFKYTKSQYEATLSSMDIERFDLFVYSYYKTPDYTDIILWLNGISSKHDLTAGDTILLPDPEDIKKFYLEFK